jgi:hypothetical protein
MMQTNVSQKQTGEHNGDRREDKLREKIVAQKTLSHDDRRTFAINLGKLANLIEPDDPKAGIKKIIHKSELGGKWEKRKRFFRLPNEEAPTSSKDGTYSADPRVFLKFAVASGHLLSRTHHEGVLETAIRDAVKMMAKGSSFLPSFSPESSADRSVKSLLDEYAIRLAEAIKDRTKIVELWEVLETSPIKLKIFWDDEVEKVEASPFGEAAIFPSELLQPDYSPQITFGRLEPCKSDLDLLYADYEWAEPTLELGIFAARYDVRLFCVPKNKHELFQVHYTGSENDDPGILEDHKVSEWLHEIGSDFEWNELVRLPDLDYDIDGIGWKTFSVSLLQNVGLGVSRGPRNEVKIQLGAWGLDSQPYAERSTRCLFTPSGGRSRFVLEKAEQSYVEGSHNPCSFVQLYLPPVYNGKVSLDEWQDEYDGGFFLELLWNFLSHRDQTTDEYLAIMPTDWQMNPHYWTDEELCEEYQGFRKDRTWTDDPNVAKLLFGADNIRFYPKISQAEPEGSAARAGSIGASLLHNAAVASDENRITKLLIDRVALAANSGIGFHEAMIDAHREAIRQI